MAERCQDSFEPTRLRDRLDPGLQLLVEPGLPAVHLGPSARLLRARLCRNELPEATHLGLSDRLDGGDGERDLLGQCRQGLQDDHWFFGGLPVGLGA